MEAWRKNHSFTYLFIFMQIKTIMKGFVLGLFMKLRQNAILKRLIGVGTSEMRLRLCELTFRV